MSGKENLKTIKTSSLIINKVNYLENKKDNVDCLKEDQRKFIEKNKLILKTQQTFRSERHNVFTKEINKIAIGLNDDKIIQSIHSIETYAHGMSKDLIQKKEKSKCFNIIKQCKNV